MKKKLIILLTVLTLGLSIGGNGASASEDELPGIGVSSKPIISQKAPTE